MGWIELLIAMLLTGGTGAMLAYLRHVECLSQRQPIRLDSRPAPAPAASAAHRPAA